MNIIDGAYGQQHQCREENKGQIRGNRPSKSQALSGTHTEAKGARKGGDIKDGGNGLGGEPGDGKFTRRWDGARIGGGGGQVGGIGKGSMIDYGCGGGITKENKSGSSSSNSSNSNNGHSSNSSSSSSNNGHSNSSISNNAHSSNSSSSGSRNSAGNGGFQNLTLIGEAKETQGSVHKVFGTHTTGKLALHQGMEVRFSPRGTLWAIVFRCRGLSARTTCGPGQEAVSRHPQVLLGGTVGTF